MGSNSRKRHIMVKTNTTPFYWILLFPIIEILCACGHKEASLIGSWQSHINDSIYLETTFMVDTIFYFDEVSLSLSRYKYTLVNDTLRFFSGNKELNPEHPLIIVEIDKDRFCLVYPDGEKGIFYHVDTLTQINVYSILHSEELYVDCFWKRRYRYLLKMGLDPTYYEMKHEPDALIDTLAQKEPNSKMRSRTD